MRRAQKHMLHWRALVYVPSTRAFGRLLEPTTIVAEGRDGDAFVSAVDSVLTCSLEQHSHIALAIALKPAVIFNRQSFTLGFVRLFHNRIRTLSVKPERGFK